MRQALQQSGQAGAGRSDSDSRGRPGLPDGSKDGKTQTIELKRTYRFHTGRPVRAANFVAAFNRDADPKLGSPATAYLREIVGADAVIDGKARTIAGVRALGPYALRSGPRGLSVTWPRA